MFKALYNQIDIGLRFELRGPFMVKERSPMDDDEAGQNALKARSDTFKEPDMLFVRIARPDRSGNLRLEPHIPGSSIKGVLRSHAERIARTLKPNSCCDPLSDGNGRFAQPEPYHQSCSLRLTETRRGRNPGGGEAYRESCPICRVFGNSSLRGRLEADDAYLVGGTGEVTQPPAPLNHDAGSTSPWWWRKEAWVSSGSGFYLGERTGISVDRFTGGVKEGPYQYECLEEGAFQGALRLRNYEIWQLGLLAILLRDLRAGDLRLGFGKNRGLGKVRVDIEEIRVSYYGGVLPWHGEFWGIGRMLANPSEYGVGGCDSIVVEGLGDEGAEALAGISYGRVYRYDQEKFEAVWREAAKRWVGFIRNGVGEVDAAGEGEGGG